MRMEPRLTEGDRIIGAPERTAVPTGEELLTQVQEIQDLYKLYEASLPGSMEHRGKKFFDESKVWLIDSRNYRLIFGYPGKQGGVYAFYFSIVEYSGTSLCLEGAGQLDLLTPYKGWEDSPRRIMYAKWIAGYEELLADALLGLREHLEHFYRTALLPLPFEQRMLSEMYVTLHWDLKREREAREATDRERKAAEGRLTNLQQACSNATGALERTQRAFRSKGIKDIRISLEDATNKSYQPIFRS